jgi:hypothetical protein
MSTILPDQNEVRNAGAGGQTDPAPLTNLNPAGAETTNIDLREALFNDGSIGLIGSIQVSTERIVSLWGIMFDLDPDLFRQGGLIATIPQDAAGFYRDIVKPMLDRHPVLKKAEVRMTGRGLHVILRFAKPVEFTKPGEQEEWAGIVEVVQTALPIDPGQPGITATTRAVGSVNGKNGATVELLEKGSPVTEEEVRALCKDMCEQPFRTVMSIFTGNERVQPCPICKKADSALAAGKHVGSCYGCGKVHLEKLYDLVLAPKTAEKAENAPKTAKREKRNAKAR